MIDTITHTHTDAAPHSGQLSSIDDILTDVIAGKPVIIVDDENRENEGDLILAADMTTPESINFLAKEGRGLICLPMESTMVDRLNLPLMGRGDNSRHRTAFTVSIEAKEGITTGISAADRAKTILSAIDPKTGPHDIATPGHIFPLRAQDGGVLVRAGHTEAAVDLARLAGFQGAGVICEIMNDDGTMARLPDLFKFAEKHDLKVGTIADLIAYRRQKDRLVQCIYEGTYSHGQNEYRLYIYANQIHYQEHIVLVKGDIQPDNPVTVRMHRVSPLDDLLDTSKTGPLSHSIKMVEEQSGAGVIVLLRNSDPKFLSKSLMSSSKKSASVQDNGGPPQSDDILRNYGIGAQILKDIGVKKMVLLSTSTKTIAGLEGYDLEIVDQIKI